jgi:hypothetical protein
MKRAMVATVLLIACAATSSAEPLESLQFAGSYRWGGIASQESIVVFVRAKNMGSETVRFSGGLLLRLGYEPNPSSIAMMKSRRDSITALRSNSGSRCGILPEYPRVTAVHGTLNLDSPTTVSLSPGEVIADSIRFELDRSQFRNWPGSVVVKTALWVHGDRPGSGWTLHPPEPFVIAIPVP